MYIYIYITYIQYIYTIYMYKYIYKHKLCFFFFSLFVYNLSHLWLALKLLVFYILCNPLCNSIFLEILDICDVLGN